MTNYKLNTFSENELMQQGLCEAIVSSLKKAEKARGFASLVVSGGSTPKRLFTLLSQSDIPWQNITVSLADDRWVPADHVDSNENLVRTYLLKDKAQKARFISLRHSEGDVFSGEKGCHQALQELPMPIDVLILGMGEDGHTASLFPCSSQLNDAVNTTQQWCKGVSPQTAPHDRMTLTLPVLKASKNIFLQIAGDKKREVLNVALEDLASPEQMPIRYFLGESSEIGVYWSP